MRIPLTVEAVESAQRERKCVCGLVPNQGTQAIVMRSPDEYSELLPPPDGEWGHVFEEACPRCGRLRLVYATYMGGVHGR
jgi:hypothetical protein